MLSDCFSAIPIAYFFSWEIEIKIFCNSLFWITGFWLTYSISILFILIAWSKVLIIASLTAQRPARNSFFCFLVLVLNVWISFVDNTLIINSFFSLILLFSTISIPTLLIIILPIIYLFSFFKIKSRSSTNTN
ncbi:Hypothetical transmembrane protein [Mycoplasma mycoides subsp. mycoides SC str. PG1]|uniref:Hypothetical transmembrane protein n=1 Tax=Mycoplasma mycoides subsp. mycoides SC (strain CCUG 32753 / NCTC 10114 / PG1) TaxID=272632 RepID=Q6MT34_MYCMS|nr:Hypothetical transmembrane protein [Mycoplasma mycoides subsp. mycoides SC str. PG1]